MRRALNWTIRGRCAVASHILLAPASIWLAFFMLVPVAFLLALGFAKNGAYGAIEWSLTFGNFAKALDPKYLPVLVRTLVYAAACTGICLALGFPVAYFLSFYAGRWRDRLLVLLMLPFWTSCLVAIYSWIIILGNEGLLNSLLVRAGVLRTPISFLNTPFSVILGLVYFYLPFMVLPLYSSLEKVPRSLIEASEDLGASGLATFRKVTLPLCLPGVFAGSILTFIPCMGDFLTADFLGGPNTYLMGNLIQSQFLANSDWPFGAALTAMLLMLLAVGLIVYQRLEAEVAE